MLSICRDINQKDWLSKLDSRLTVDMLTYPKIVYKAKEERTVLEYMLSEEKQREH